MFLPGAERPTTQLVKLDRAGTKLWTLSLGPGLWGSGELAVFPAGDVVVGACSAPFCFADTANGAPPVEASIVRVSSAGTVAWTVAVPGSGFWSVEADSRGRTLAVVDANPQPRLVILDGRGTNALDAPTDIAQPRAAFGGESGDFVVGGQDAGGRPVFERRGSDGSTRFRKLLDTPSGTIDRIDFAPNGSIALGGWFQDRLTWGATTHTPSFRSGFLAVGGGDGSAQWSTADLSLATGGSVPPYVAFGVDNDVVAYTQTFGKGQANLRSYTRDGALQWQRGFSGIFGTWVNAIALATSGDVVVGGNGTADAPFQGLAFAKETHFVAVIVP